GDALGLRRAGAVDDPVGDLARLLVEHPALKRGREVLDRAEILDLPVLDAQVRGRARLLALAASSVLSSPVSSAGVSGSVGSVAGAEGTGSCASAWNAARSSSSPR